MEWFVITDTKTQKPLTAISLGRISAWRVLPKKLEVVVDGYRLTLAMSEPATQQLLDLLTSRLNPA